MAGISAGRQTFFRVGPAELAKPECFAVRRGETRERVSPEYHRPEYRELFTQLRGKFPGIHHLGYYGEVICGPFGTQIKLSDYVEAGVPLLRISNITDEGTLDMKGMVFITPEKSESLDRTRVYAGDIVISQRGTIGMHAVVSSDYPAFNISANLIAVRGLSLNPRFVQLYLASRPGERQITRLQSGQVHAKITTDDVASILIPNMPNQSELVAAMDAAQAERRDKLAEADRLLAGVDGFVLATLGIAPVEDTRRVFAVRLRQTRDSGRLNPNYYHPQRTQTLRLLEPSPSLNIVPLSGLADFVRDQIPTPGENYLSMSHVQSHTGEFVDAGNTAVGSCYVFQVDDVLFSRMAPNLNKVYRAEWNGCCSTEFHVLRVKDLAAVLPEYLAAFLRSSLMLAQTVHMATGSTRPRLSNDEVVNLRIPVPDMGTQETIANEVIRRREESRRLRAEAESGWQAAREWFEGEVLGYNG